jgi:hypothetical protein
MRTTRARIEDIARERRLSAGDIQTAALVEQDSATFMATLAARPSSEWSDGEIEKLALAEKRLDLIRIRYDSAGSRLDGCRIRLVDALNNLIRQLWDASDLYEEHLVLPDALAPGLGMATCEELAPKVLAVAENFLSYIMPFRPGPECLRRAIDTEKYLRNYHALRAQATPA